MFKSSWDHERSTAAQLSRGVAICADLFRNWGKTIKPAPTHRLFWLSVRFQCWLIAKLSESLALRLLHFQNRELK